jgi:hypothetical protein
MNGPLPPHTLSRSILAGDLAQDPLREPLWRQLGADSCRVALIELVTLQPRAWRWMSRGGVASGKGDAQALDQLLPGADMLLGDWAVHSATEPETVITHMLSPRRWVYFWRVNERVALLVQMHFLLGRQVSHEFDTAGVRVICEHWLADEVRRAGAGAVSRPSPPDKAASAPPSHSLRLALVCLLGCLLASLWLVLFGAASVSGTDIDAGLDLARRWRSLGALVAGLSTLGAALIWNQLSQREGRQ